MSNFNIDLKNISLIDFAKKEVDILKVNGECVWYKYEDPNQPGRFLAYKLNQNATVNGDIKQVKAIAPPIVTFQGVDDLDPIDIDITNPGTNIIAPFTGIDVDQDGVDSGVDIDDNDGTVGSQVYVEILGSSSDATFYQNNQEGLKFNHPVGSLVTVQVVAVAGKRFTEWSATGAQLLGSELVQQEITFTMPRTNVILTPSFATGADFQYSLVVNQDDGGTVSGGGSYKALQEIELTATPRIGYNFVRWESNDVVVYSPNEVTTRLLMPDSNVAVTPIFEPQEFVVTLNDTAGGSLDISSHTLNAGVVDVKFEETVEISAVPSTGDGYSFVRWHISGFTFSGDINNPTLSFSMPAADVTISAEFEAAEFDVVIAPTSTGTSSGSGVYAPGTLVTIASTPPSTNSWAYEFVGWSASGVTLLDASAETTTFVMPGNNVNISFSYSRIKATVSVALPTDGGVTINSQSVTSLEVDAGTTVSISASIPTEYSFESWTVSSNNASLVDVNAVSTTFVMPAENVNLAFTMGLASYTLDILSNVLTSNNFNISVNGLSSTKDFPTSLEVQAQSNVVISIAANDPDQTLTSIVPTGIDSPDINVSSSLISFNMPSNNCSILAGFEQTQFELSINIVNPFPGDTDNDSILEQDMVVEISENSAFTSPTTLEYLSATSTAVDAPVTDPSDLDFTGGIWFPMTAIPKDYWVRIKSIPPNGSKHEDWTSNKDFVTSGTTTQSTLSFNSTNNTSIPFQMPSDNVRLTTNMEAEPIFRVIPVGGVDTFNLGIPMPIRVGHPSQDTGTYDGNDPDLMNISITPQIGTGLEYKYRRFDSVSITINSFSADQDFVDRPDVTLGFETGNYTFTGFAQDLIGIERASDQQYISTGIDVLSDPVIQANNLTFKIPNVIDPEDHNIMIVVEYEKSLVTNAIHLSIPGYTSASTRPKITDQNGTELVPVQIGNSNGTSYPQGTAVTLTVDKGSLAFDNWEFSKFVSSDDETFVPTSSTHDLDNDVITFTLMQDLSVEAALSNRLIITDDFSDYTEDELSESELAIIRDACDYLEDIIKPVADDPSTTSQDEGLNEWVLTFKDFPNSAPGGVLASAGILSWKQVEPGTFLSDNGYARFDPADTPDAATSTLGDKTELWYTTVHELIHAFGISSGQWNNSNLGTKSDLIEISEKWGAQYKGTHGVAAYNQFWGTNLTRVPIQTKQVNAVLLNINGVPTATAPISSINARYALSWHTKNLTAQDVSSGTCKHADVFNAYTSESSSSTLDGIFSVPAQWEVEIVSANTSNGYTMIGDFQGSNPEMTVFTGSSIVIKSPFHSSHPLEFYDEQGQQITVSFDNSSQTYTFTPQSTNITYDYRCGFHQSMAGSINVVSSWSSGQLVKYAVANTWSAHIAETETRRSNLTTTTTDTLFSGRKYEGNQQPLMDELLMTPYIEKDDPIKISSITAGMLKDLGWELREKHIDTRRPVEWIMEEASVSTSPSFTEINQSSNYSASSLAFTSGVRFRLNNIPDWLANLDESNIRIIAHRKSFSFPADVSWNFSSVSGSIKMSGSGWNIQPSELLSVDSSEKTLTFSPVNLSSGRSVGGNIVHDTIGLDESMITIYNALDSGQNISSAFFWTIPGASTSSDSLSWEEQSQTIFYEENETGPINYNLDYNIFGDTTTVVEFSLSGNDANLFDINQSSGVISFKSSPDFETPQDANSDNVYNISVTAYDPENPDIVSPGKDLSIVIVNKSDFVVSITVDGGRLQGYDAQYSEVQPVTLTGIHNEGETVTLVSEPFSDYRHVSWASSSAGVSISDPSNATLSFTMPGNNVEINLTSEKYIWDLSLHTTRGTVSSTDITLSIGDPASDGTRSGSGEYTTGQQITLTSVPDTGYTHKAWSSTSHPELILGPASLSLSLTLPAADLQLELECETESTVPETAGIYLSVPSYATYSSTSNKFYVKDHNDSEIVPIQGGNMSPMSYQGGSDVTLTAVGSGAKVFDQWTFARWNTSDTSFDIPTSSTHDLTSNPITFNIKTDLSVQAQFIDPPETILTVAEFDAMTTSELSALTVVDASPVAGESEPSVGSVFAIYEILADYSNMNNPYYQGSIVDYGLVTEIVDDQYNVSHNQAAYTGKQPGAYAGSYTYWSNRFKVKLKSSGAIYFPNHIDFSQGWEWDILR